MRVYKFLSLKYGLKALRERRLKISEIPELNDPYELLPFDLTNPQLREGLVRSKEQFALNRGPMCFSAGWSNPVVWSHYAECHKGLCFGFEVEAAKTWRVEYVEAPLVFSAVNEETARAMVYTKYSHWKYEEEVRMWASLEESSKGQYFHPFGEALQLAEIIVGVGSPVSRRRLLEILERHTEGIRIIKARRAYDTFRMIEDEAGLN